MQMLVRMDGMVEKVLERLVVDGYYKTRAEAVRAGILEIGREYAIIGNKEPALVSKRISQMQSEVKSGKKRMVPLEEVAARAQVRI